MDLNTVWFILITVLFTGFFVLEGFDYGAGILLPFLGKRDEDRRAIINTIGPVWDGNEVWMITAGGALFASFPHVYATLFSGAYLALVLMLLALIARGVAFEFRSKREDLAWRGRWDWAIFVGSLAPALLWEVAVGSLMRQGRRGLAFLMGSLTIVLATVMVFAGLYPRILISTLNPAWTLTIHNASSSPYTLKVMTIVALIFVPIVLAYQIWTYSIFRKRIGRQAEDLIYRASTVDFSTSPATAGSRWAARSWPAS